MEFYNNHHTVYQLKMVDFCTQPHREYLEATRFLSIFLLVPEKEFFESDTPNHEQKVGEIGRCQCCYGTTVILSLTRRFDKLAFDVSYVQEGCTYTVTTGPCCTSATCNLRPQQFTGAAHYDSHQRSEGGAQPIIREQREGIPTKSEATKNCRNLRRRYGHVCLPTNCTTKGCIIYTFLSTIALPSACQMSRLRRRKCADV